MVIASAPGKIILFGEHAVVYNKLGIAASIDKRCYVKVFSTNGDNVSIEAKDLNLSKSLDKKTLFDFFATIDSSKSRKKFNEIKKIYKKDKLAPSFFVVACILRKYGFRGLKLELESEIPKNLGSSSSVFAAIALGVSNFLGKNLSKKEISDLTFQGDIIAHGGTPSGIDNNIVTFGGFLQYKKSEGAKPLDINLELPLVIVDSGEPARTSETVSTIRESKEKNPKFVNPILDKLEEISLVGIEALRSKNLQKTGNLMTDYYSELKKLGISTEKLDRIIKLALENKALGTKPTGGWGGGCCLVLARNQKEISNLIRIFKENNFNAFQTKVGVEGVKIAR